jgi:uncharacterized protein YndB with AHSA1/START domain
MRENLVAQVSTIIDAPRAKVWDALVSSEAAKKYMFGTTVVTDWKEGSEIFWRGEWQGKSYEDKGVILRCEPGRALAYTHFSPLFGLPDTLENYHTVTIELSSAGDQTSVSLSQDNNSTEQAREHSEKNWGTMLEALKKHVEGEFLSA